MVGFEEVFVFHGIFSASKLVRPISMSDVLSRKSVLWRFDFREETYGFKASFISDKRL